MSSIEEVYKLLQRINAPKKIDFTPDPPLLDKKGNIIYCHFCSRHPVYKRRVPAVTYTHDKHPVPRCGPCGRWRE